MDIKANVLVEVMYELPEDVLKEIFGCFDPVQLVSAMVQSGRLDPEMTMELIGMLLWGINPETPYHTLRR